MVVTPETTMEDIKMTLMMDTTRGTTIMDMERQLAEQLELDHVSDYFRKI